MFKKFKDQNIFGFNKILGQKFWSTNDDSVKEARHTAEASLTVFITEKDGTPRVQKFLISVFCNVF